MSVSRFIAFSLAFAAHAGAHACWDEAAKRHGVPASLLYAIAKVESGLDPKAINRSHQVRTGSIDIGLMQINSRHLPQLAKQGIVQADLLSPCRNIDVGAGLLADIFSRQGANWDSVGAYNAACTELKGDDCRRARRRYAWKVYAQLPRASNVQAPVAAPQSQRAAALTPLLAVRVAQ